MPPGSDTFELVQTSVRVEGNDEDIIFTNLVVSQQLADTNSFSFIWRKEQQNANFATHVDFYRAYLGKEATITIGDNFTFKGIVSSITCVNQDELASHYQLSGKGLFCKLDEVEECNSFYHKSLSDIFNDLNTTQDTTLHLSPNNTNELFYHVQYNTTTFNFYKMMAVRYGEWFYYTGTEMVLAAPDGDAVELVNGIDVTNLNISATAHKATVPGVGYDQYSGEILTNTPSASQSSGLIGVSTEAADSTFGSDHTARRIAGAPTSDLLREMNTLMQQAVAASTVFIEGTTRRSAVKLGGKIRIIDIGGNSEGEYIVTQIQHSSYNESHYQNHFVAVPADVQVPPYTNPLVYPVCYAQQATVVENEDADGLDRIKVHFPWMQDGETSPWISVMVPYAGNGRGMRFIPEIDEEVMVDFVDNNAERPFMIGSFYTTTNPSGVAHEGNNIKVFGTRSGRRLEINDEEGTLKIFDNASNETPLNGLQLTRKDDQTNVILECKTDNQNYTLIRLNKEESLSLGLVNGGEVKTEIRLLKNGPEIKINSKGSINIQADGDLNLTASGSMKLSASNKLEMKGDGGVEVKGMTIKAEADTSLEMKGISTKIEGVTTLEAKGGALASLEGAIVKIN